MALFDDLGRLGKTVAGRAKNAAETGNLKLQIANAQKEVTKAYAELGRKFAELNPDSVDESLKPLLDAAKAAARVGSLQSAELMFISSSTKKERRKSRNRRRLLPSVLSRWQLDN